MSVPSLPPVTERREECPLSTQQARSWEAVGDIILIGNVLSAERKSGALERLIEIFQVIMCGHVEKCVGWLCKCTECLVLVSCIAKAATEPEPTQCRVSDEAEPNAATMTNTTATKPQCDSTTELTGGR